MGYSEKAIKGIQTDNRYTMKIEGFNVYRMDRLLNHFVWRNMAFDINDVYTYLCIEIPSQKYLDSLTMEEKFKTQVGIILPFIKGDSFRRILWRSMELGEKLLATKRRSSLEFVRQS